MQAIIDCIDRIRAGRSLTDAECGMILRDQPAPYQLTTLAIQLIHKKLTATERSLLVGVFRENPGIFAVASAACPGHPLLDSFEQPRDSAPSMLADDLAHVLAATSDRSALGSGVIDPIIRRFVRDELDLTFLAAWLMTIDQRGISASDRKIQALHRGGHHRAGRTGQDAGQCYDR